MLPSVPAAGRRPLFTRLFGQRGSTRPAIAEPAAARRTIAICHALLSARGEISGTHIATELLASYRKLQPPAVDAFFDLLAREFSPDPAKIRRAADAYHDEPCQTNLTTLQRTVESSRPELFRRINAARGGTATLIEMRRDILRGLEANPDWRGVEGDLIHVFKSWFNPGFLELRQIDWATPAFVLEKLIRYEAVHAIQAWEDLRRRLQADRRCYAFFHQALPDEPLIFIEIALTHGMSAEVQPLLDRDAAVYDDRSADSAMFYSITNCQEGLRGVSFGNLLIKRVAETLGRELPRLRTFATLSPIPGFRKWLTDRAALEDASSQRPLAAIVERLNTPNWWRDPALSSALKEDVMPLCAAYLLRSKPEKGALDPVARFHLGNGARIERLNWLGDTSAQGMRQSAGLTVNYVYRLSEVERNHQAYTRDFRIVASRWLERLAKK
jgi:malonyl-CoA decarboxylase